MNDNMKVTAEINLANYITEERMKNMADKIFEERVTKYIDDILEARKLGGLNIIDMMLDRAINKYIGNIEKGYEDEFNKKMIAVLSRDETQVDKDTIDHFYSTLDYKIHDIISKYIENHAHV